MTHPRTLIRRAVTARLVASGTAAADRVYASRLAPIDTDDNDELPAILVYARDDRRDPKTDYGIDAEDSRVTSHLYLVTEAVIRANDDVDDKVDDLAEEIEAALDDWEIPGFEGATIRLEDTDIDVVKEQVRRPVAAIGLTWVISYDRPWRVRPEGTRPDTVDVIMNGGPPARLITKDRGPRNPGPKP